jgi:hypothetical protein
VVTLPEISKVLSAHPGIRRAETVIVRCAGRDVVIAAGVLIVEEMPVAGGVHDDFLELGGDSLSALGIIAAWPACFASCSADQR